MRLHYLQHVEFEGLGYIATWAAMRGIAVNQTRLYANDPLPNVGDFDMLVVMGGPMNIYEHDAYPWLVAEKAFIRSAIDDGKRVLGICLGAQLIADTLGGKVTRNSHKEIGWFPIKKAPSAEDFKPFDALPDTLSVLHWHGDTFAIPPGGILLASSAGCLNQAFAFGDSVLGLQFHMELTQALAEELAHECADDFTLGPFVQKPETLLAAGTAFNQANEHLAALLDRFIAP